MILIIIGVVVREIIEIYCINCILELWRWLICRILCYNIILFVVVSFFCGYEFFDRVVLKFYVFVVLWIFVRIYEFVFWLILYFVLLGGDNICCVVVKMWWYFRLSYIVFVEEVYLSWK